MFDTFREEDAKLKVSILGLIAIADFRSANLSTLADQPNSLRRLLSISINILCVDILTHSKVYTIEGTHMITP